jgi:predicted Zn-dependent protease
MTMRTHSKNAFRPFLLKLGLMGVFSFAIAFVSQAQGNANSSLRLSQRELLEIRSTILSSSVDYEKRVQLANSTVIFLEKANQASDARHLCLTFYTSVAPYMAYQDMEKPASAPPKPITDAIKAIDQGKRTTAIKQYQALLTQNYISSLDSSLAIVALKADDMATSYQAFFSDLLDQKLSAYTYYMLGILFAREKRFIESERLLELSNRNLGLESLDRWLAIDLIKIALVVKNHQKAETVTQEWLAKNANDPHFINLWIRTLVEQNKLDIARQKLAQIIPLLYEDPYLVSETAYLANQLNDNKTAAAILQKMENKVEPNHDFYATFSLICKSQGREEDAKAYQEKAAQIRDSRVNVSNGLPNSDIPIEELRKTIHRQQEKRREEIANMDTANSLDRVYLYLLSHDPESAIAELTAITSQEKFDSNAHFVLASIQRRSGLLPDAIQTLETLYKNRPKFRTYQVLSLLADFYVRTNNYAQAKRYYDTLEKAFPDSYQAEIARAFLKQENTVRHNVLSPIAISPLMSRYDQYGPPFVISEVMNYWGNRAKFTSISNLLGTSPRRSLQFDEFLSALVSGTRYQIFPFIANTDVLQEFMIQKIPVIFCQGEMFSTQRISTLTLIAGMDSHRKIVYSESINPWNQYLYTETEMQEGLCLAVHPTSVKINLTPAMKEAVLYGREFINLNTQVLKSQRQSFYDNSEFERRRIMVQADNNPYLRLHKLSFLRWTILNEPLEAAKQYAASLTNCETSSLYWSLLAQIEFGLTKSEQTLDSILDKAIDKAPADPLYQLAKIRALIKINKVEQALTIAEHLREAYPENPRVSAHLVAIYKKAGLTQLEEEEKIRLKNLIHIDIVDINFDE